MQNSKPIEIYTFFLSLLSTVVIILSGLLGYFYRDQWIVNESKINSDVAKVEYLLKNIELDVSEMKAQLDVESAKVNLSVDYLKLLDSLRPNISINIKHSYTNGLLTIKSYIKNLGEQSVVVERAVISISMDGNKNFKGIPLKEGSISTTKMGYLPANGEEYYIDSTVDIKSNVKELGRPIYYKIKFEINTNKEVVDVAKQLLKGVIEEDVIDRISTSSFTTHSPEVYSD